VGLNTYVYLCSITFKNNNIMKQLLIDRVIEQIMNDIAIGDITSLEELLTFVPEENLIGYLPEEEWERFENEYQCQNCGGGFLKEEMDFDVDDVDLCKNCNHKTFNDAPYGDE
jgi:DNA-directed RNA polymerase subunit RPC12/RpoP